MPYFEVTIDPNNERSFKFYFKDSLYVSRYFDGFYKKIIDDKIGLNGIKLNSDSFNIKWNNRVRQIRHYNLNNEFVYFIILTDSSNYTKKEFLFNKYDHDLNLLKSVDFASNVELPVNVTFITSWPISSEYFIVACNSQVANPLKYESRYFMFDGNGGYVDRTDLVIYGDPNIEYGWHRPLADVMNKRLLLTRSQQDDKSTPTKYDIYVTDGDSLRSIHQLEVEGTTDHFRTTYHQMLDNGDILLFIDQFDWADQNIRWFSWILLDGAKMGIISNTKDVKPTSNIFKLYPNPSSGIVKIENLVSPTTIHISDINGQLVKIITNGEHEINISDLPKGMYIFDISSNEIKERHKIVKVE